MFKKHYIDEIEYPPSPICGEKPKFESNVTSFQFRQIALAQGFSSATLLPRRFGGENEVCHTLKVFPKQTHLDAKQSYIFKEELHQN